MYILISWGVPTVFTGSVPVVVAACCRFNFSSLWLGLLVESLLLNSDRFFVAELVAGPHLAVVAYWWISVNVGQILMVVGCWWLVGSGGPCQCCLLVRCLVNPWWCGRVPSSVVTGRLWNSCTRTNDSRVVWSPRIIGFDEGGTYAEKWQLLPIMKNGVSCHCFRKINWLKRQLSCVCHICLISLSIKPIWSMKCSLTSMNHF